MPRSSSSNPLEISTIVAKLTLGLGEEKATRVVTECLREARLSRLTSSDELERLAERLIARGGFICIVGRSLMVDAIMLRRDDLS